MRTLGDVAPRFHAHVFFAREDVINKQSAQVSRFLKAWVRTHKSVMK